MMMTRVLTALLGVPLILLVGWLGGLWLLAAVGVLVLVTQNELMRLLRDLAPHRGLVFTGGLLLAAAAHFGGAYFPGPGFTVSVIMVLGAMVLFYPRFSPRTAAGTTLAVFYPSLLYFIYLLRGLPDGWVWLLMLLFGTWAFDTFGYFIGTAAGRIRITPHLSPNKSLEGLIGGLGGAVLVVFGIARFMLGEASYDWALMGLALALAAQSGDLVASAFKRPVNAKDSGNLLPGHGGVLDRFDSLILTAPVVYYFVTLFR